MSGQSATAVGESKVVTGTAHTLQPNEDGVTLLCTNASAVAITIPAGLPDDFELGVIQSGAGQVTFVAGAGVTLHGASGLVATAAQYAAIGLIWVATNSFVVVGNTA